MMTFTKPITRTSHLLLRLAGFSCMSSTTSACRMIIGCRLVVCNPIHFNRSFASCRTGSPLHSANGFRVFRWSDFGLEQLGFCSFWVLSGGGDDGKAGGGCGGFGNESSGGIDGNASCGSN